VEGPRCAWDESTGPESAVELKAEDEQTGQICPVEDEDWYVVETEEGEDLVEVRLAMDAPLSPVQPTYAFWTVADEGEPGEAVAVPPADAADEKLEVVHCLAPGRYYLVVRDHGGDDQDLRRGYALSVHPRSEADAHEPNDSAEHAVELRSGEPVEAAVSCRGDEDWYGLTVPKDQSLRLELKMPVAGIQPTLRVLDFEQETIRTETNEAATVRETSMGLVVVVSKPGRHYVVVSDDDGVDADPDTIYTLTAELFSDSDPNEPNPDPDHATPLSEQPVECGASWSKSIEIRGTIGAPGDADWYRLPLRGCDPGVIEAELSFEEEGTTGNLLSEVQAQLTLVRGHERSACTEASGCLSLRKSCKNGYDCEGIGNACLSEGLCAGVGVCLPEGRCGASWVERHVVPPGATEGDKDKPVSNAVRTAAPIQGDEVIYLKVTDFQSNGSVPNAQYRLSVRVREEPDEHEPNNVYTPVLTKSTYPIQMHQQRALEIGVHDCVTRVPPNHPEGVPLPEPDCCGPGDWIEGFLSYENDSDWFRYDHPCPGGDCMMRVHYEVDGGPVDPIIALYAQKNLWYDLFFLKEADEQEAASGAYGGLELDDQCFYAWTKHRGDPFSYFLSFRDVATRPDWSGDQRYRFCVELIADGCEEPCKTWHNGCGQEQ
jgi:hypothetical protein